jgi:hypothetical protein
MFRITFFVDDKNLAAVLRGVAGQARNLEVVPVVNAEPTAKNGVQQKAGSLTELFLAELGKLTGDFRASDARKACAAAGASPKSYGTYVKRLINARLIKSSGKGTGMTYRMVK